MESLGLPPREACIAKAPWGLIEKTESPIELLPLLSPTPLKAPCEDAGTGQDAVVLVFRYRFGGSPGFSSEKRTRYHQQSPLTGSATAKQVSEYPPPASRIKPAREESPNLIQPEMHHQSASLRNDFIPPLQNYLIEAIPKKSPGAAVCQLPGFIRPHRDDGGYPLGSMDEP
jgi:hypothetical protein